MTAGPPFTMGRYDSLGACITAEREWLAEENERLSRRLSGALQHLEEAREGLANYAQENAELRRCLDGGVDCAEEKLRLRAELDALKRTREQERDYADVCYENEGLRQRCLALAYLLYPTGEPPREAVEGDI